MALAKIITLENAVIGVDDHLVLKDVNLSVKNAEIVTGAFITLSLCSVIGLIIFSII